MSLATIIKKIDDEAEVQSHEIIEQARVEDEQIVTYARVKAEEEAVGIMRHAKEELQTVKNKQKATTLLHLRKEKLDNRQRNLQEVFTQVLNRLRALDGERLREIFKSILLSVSEERAGEVVPSKTDASLLDQAFIDTINAELEQQNRTLRFTLSEQTATIERGFLIDFEDFDVNYSVEKVLASLWEELKGDVSKRLFEGHK